MKVVHMQKLAEGASLWTLAGVSAWASTIAPIVAVVAGVVATAWSVIQIYSWVQERKAGR